MRHGGRPQRHGDPLDGHRLGKDLDAEDGIFQALVVVPFPVPAVLHSRCDKGFLSTLRSAIKKGLLAQALLSAVNIIIIILLLSLFHFNLICFFSDFFPSAESAFPTSFVACIQNSAVTEGRSRSICAENSYDSRKWTRLLRLTKYFVDETLLLEKL